MIPSEKFLMFHRVITFLDEWIFYALLLFLFYNNAPFWIFIAAIVIGTLAISTSYSRLWGWEDMRHNSTVDATEAKL